MHQEEGKQEKARQEMGKVKQGGAENGKGQKGKGKSLNTIGSMNGIDMESFAATPPVESLKRIVSCAAS